MNQKEIDVLKKALEKEKTSRKLAEKKLKETSVALKELTKKIKLLEKQKALEFNNLFENIVDAHVVMDLLGNVLRMNKAAVNLFGYKTSKKEYNLLELVSPSESEYAIQTFRNMVKDGFVTDFQIEINTASKEKKLVQASANVIRDAENRPIAAQAIIRDVTKEKEAKKQLEESENRLSILIKNLDSGVLLEDENRKIVLANRKFCELFSIPVNPEYLIGEDCSNSAEQSKAMFKNPNEFISRIDEILQYQKIVIGDELKMTNGKILERDYIPIYKKSEFKGHMWSYRDITLERNYSISIEAEREKYRSIIANMNLGLVEVNQDDEIQMINQSFYEMTGYTEAELLGKKAAKMFLLGNGKEIIARESEKRKYGESNSYEVKAKTKQGEVRYWLISGAPNYNINGELVGSIGVHLDITDLKQLQLQKEQLLNKLEKSNEELQEYAHVVSHDLKSPLRSIYALVSWLKEDNKDQLNSESIQNITHIETTLERMEQLISDVLKYSSIGAERVKRVNVNIDVLVQDVVKLIYKPKHIDIFINNKLPIIKGDQIKLQQLFQNLIANAIKFIDKSKGSIIIDVKELNNSYQFSVSDNGIGIENKFHNRIFKIFHSVNKSKDSTGIGLAIVKKIVNLHGGEIWLESVPKKGTTFYFTLKK